MAHRRPRAFTTFHYPLIALAACAYAASAHAASVTWTPNASGSWTSPADWSSNPALPGPADDVTINQPGTIIVTLSSNTQSINSLTDDNTLTLSGGILNVATTLLVNGTLNINGGALQNATISTGASGTVNFTSGTLDGVTLNANVTVNTTAGLSVKDGLTLNGTVSAGDGSTVGILYFQGNQTLSGSGSVVLGGFAAAYYQIPTGLFVTDTTGPATLTIGQGVTVHGANGIVGSFTSPYVGTLGSSDCLLVNQGTINADTAGGTITLNAPGGLTNTGLLEATNGGTLDIGGNVTNLGTFNATGGTVALIGTLDNTGKTLALTAATGSLTLTGGGTIKNGTITTVGGAGLIVTGAGTSDGTLDGVTLNANVTVNTTAGLSVKDGLTLNGTVSAGDGSTVGILYFQGNQTLSGSGSVVLGGFAAAYYQIPTGLFVTDTTGPATLTIGQGVTVHGANGIVGSFTSPYVGTLGSSDCLLVNQGTINADTAGGTITLNAPGGLTNTGLLEATNGGTLDIGGNVTNLGTFNATGGTVALIGTLDNTGKTLALTAATGSLTLTGGGTIKNGTITTVGGAGLIVTGAGTSDGTLDGVTLNANVTVNTTAGLSVKDGLTLNGTVSAGDGSTVGILYFQGNQTLSGSGSVVLGGFAAAYYQIPTGLFVTDTTGPATLTIGQGVTVHGANGIVGSFTSPYVGTLGSSDCLLVNQGTINADTAGGTITLNAPGGLTNTGLLEATNGGTLNISSTTTLTNAGIVQAPNGGTVNFLNNLTPPQLGTFNSTGGTIQISGTLDNTNSTLALNGVGNSLLLTGTIKNGNVSIAGGAQLSMTAGAFNVASLTIGAGGNLQQSGGNITLSSLSQSGGNISLGGATQSLYAIPAITITGGATTLTKDTFKVLTTPSLAFGGSPGAWTGALDLTQNKLIVEATTGKSAALASLRDQAFFGRTNTAGIISSTSAKTFAVAVIDNALLNKSTFGGQPVDANSILISPELLGDTNIDGHVDLTDLSTILNHFGVTTPNWTDGNFDNQPTIDLTDLSDILNNFGLTNPNPSSQSSALAGGSPQPSVPTPEPTSLSLLLLPILLRNRRTDRLTT